jgi:uncharacterized protein
VTDQDYRDTIAQGWFEKAEDAFGEAEILLRESRLIGCVNRLCYAVFYAVSAALAKEGREYGKHTAVRAALHRDFVKSGKVPRTYGHTYDELFDDRQQGDYTPHVSFDKEEVRMLVSETRTFLDHFRTLVC